MKRTKKLGSKLIAILLSIAMISAPVLQSVPVYAAETGIEEGSAGTLSEDTEADAPVSDGGETEASNGEEESVPPSSDNEGTEGTEGSETDGEVTEGTEGSETDNEGTEGTEGSETDGEGTEEGGTDSEETEEGTDEEAVTEDELLEEVPRSDMEALATVSVSDFSNVGGWNESIYAEIAGVKNTDVTEVSYSGTMNGSLKSEDLKYLVRNNGNGGVRIDIPGLKAGTYTLTVKVGSSILKKSSIDVYAYDRSGYAHFGYGSGVGAYNNDGTLKKDAIVLYVTDKNKNDVELTCGSITVKGIGNILNSVGQESSGGKTSNGGKANDNKGIIKALAKAGKPLVVRFVGVVSDSGLYSQGTFSAASASKINGLTAYNSLDYGGSVKDNGHMARIQSGKDVTLEGIGFDAAIDGWGFHYIAEGSEPSLGKSFEVRNLTFINTPEDAVGMEGQQASKNTSSKLSSSVERCWIHNNEFYCPRISSPAESDKSEGDGSVDFKRGQYFTCSYNYFEGCHKTNLVGSADYSLQFNLTYHHNYWYMCKARGPLARNANIHMYNNIVDMQTDYAQNTRADAYIFSEYNLFYTCKSPQAVEAGAIKSYHDSIASVIWNKGSKATVVNDKSEYVSNNCQFQAEKIKYDKFDTDSALSYIPSNDYILDEDFTQLRKVIKSKTGVQAQNPKLPEKVASSEYSIIPAGEIKPIESLPFDDSPGKISKTVYAFRVNSAFNLDVSYSGEPGVLVNEAGENLLEGSGSVINLPAGAYMIQAVNFQPGDYLKGTAAEFKEIFISELHIKAYDPKAHYHNWKLDSLQSEPATCTEAGENVYICLAEGCTERTKSEPVDALGHSYSRAWTIDIPATDDQPGQKSHHCTRAGCDAKTDITEIPVGSSDDSGDTGAGSTAAGDYILTFEGLKENDDADFFIVTGTYSNSKGSTTVNGTTYTECLKMESKTKISFSCNDGATLFMAFASTEAGKKVIIDGKEYTTAAGGTLQIELSGGSHEISKSDSINLFYVSVANGGMTEVSYTLSFEYNYDDAPDAKAVRVLGGTSYASMSELVPVSFTRANHELKGLYADASCSVKIQYPYVVNGNAVFYADWSEGSSDDEITYSLIFDSNGGSAVATVRISSSQVYEIGQKSTKAGYAFAGWYDSKEGGTLINKVDGSKLTGNYTVYAHWNVVETVKHFLDCAKDFSAETKSYTADYDITANTEKNGFILHALPGGGGTKKDTPKYYMTAKKSKVLGTNGVLLTDKSIAGNEDGLLKSIEFTTEKSGVLAVEVALSGTPEKNGTYELVLAKKATDGSLHELGKSSITDGTTKTKKEFDIPGADTYYLYPKGDKGVVYYSLKVTERTYTVIYQPGRGTAPAGITNSTVKAGEVIQIGDCTPAPGFTFKGWSVDGGVTTFKDSYTVDTDDASDGVITIAAVYEPVTYTIKYVANGGTLPEGMEESATVSTGQRINLGECIPPEGKTFVGWAVGDSDGTITSYYTVNPTDAGTDKVITLKAVYASEGDQTVYYTVILDTDGGTLVDGGGTVRKIEANKTINPGICEKADYVFKEWTVAGKAVKIPYKVTADVTLKASYTLESIYKGISIIGLEKTYKYTGAKIIPNIGVVDYDIGDGKLLKPGVDYTVKYTDNKNKGEATITVTGKGNYAGKDITKKFTIVEAEAVTATLEDLKGAKIAKIQPQAYTGEAQYPDFTLTLKGKSAVEYTYNASKGIYETDDDDAVAIAAKVALSNNINKGTATLFLTGAKDSRNKETSVKKTFKITAVSLTANKSKVEVDAKPGTYAVKGAAPASITVKYDGRTLKNGIDYTAKYSLNKKASAAAKIMITGKGNYTGKYSDAVYSIGKLDMSELEVSAVKVYKGIKAGKITATVVDKEGNTLKPRQYTLRVYSEDSVSAEALDSAKKIDDGPVYVEAVAKDDTNLTGQTDKAEFTVGTDISKAKAVIRKVGGKTINKTYTGEQIKLGEADLEVTIKVDGKTKELHMGTGYEIVSYTNNINKGTATAVIKGIGSYSGTKTVKFKIVGKKMHIDGETSWENVSNLIKSFVGDFIN